MKARQMLGPYRAHVHVKNVARTVTGTDGFGGATTWVEGWAPRRSGQADIEAYRAVHARVAERRA